MSYKPRKITNLTLKQAYILDKLVKPTCKGGAGYFYLPKRWIGERFLVILVPEIERPSLLRSLSLFVKKKIFGIKEVSNE